MVELHCLRRIEGEVFWDLICEECGHKLYREIVAGLIERERGIRDRDCASVGVLVSVFSRGIRIRSSGGFFVSFVLRSQLVIFGACGVIKFLFRVSFAVVCVLVF